MADGVSRDKLFPMDLDRAYGKLDAIKPHVAAWWKSGDNSMQILRGGDAVMSMLYSSRAVPLAKSGEFDFTWNGAIRDTGNWAVLKGGPNTESALRFLFGSVVAGLARVRAALTPSADVEAGSRAEHLIS